MSYMEPIGTPDGIAIRPRDRKFDRTPLAARWWLAGDPVATAFYNAMSASFPLGEAFFIDVLRHFRDSAEPKLAAEIDAFIKQEAIHAREHNALNRRVVMAGYDIKPLEARVARRLDMLRQRGPLVGLAATIALEHLTAVFGNEVLSNPRHLRGSDPEIARLWRWHCIEEIEHKGVAFDMWLHATCDWSGWRRWSMRARLMIPITRRFFHDRLCATLELLRQDGFSRRRIAMAVLAFMLFRPGMMRKMLQGWFAFFRPGFHPWDHDDRHLIEDAARAEPIPATR
jgi:Predicted metal-dependent hydrolase